MDSKNWKWWYLGFFLLLNVFILMIGGVFTASSVSTWYPTLEKASWSPPNWVFGPVWTVLYVLIAIAGWLIYLTPRSAMRKKALAIYWMQLGINCLWSYLFFYLQSPSLGLLDILLLLVLLGWALFVFRFLSRFAYIIFVPYFVWTLYAATLNVAIWMLNMK
ncbi:MAG: tryptophan-rich sensory protein [Verrucomicrobia bacterium]|nr:tryptophan-rich sensory protein [Verrucomicrobiota bacterium]